MPRYLIINADDLGECAARDEGILTLARAGVLRSASLLVNGHHAEAAAYEAERAGLPLGLHLNLTEGRALNFQPPGCDVLTDADGVFRGKWGLRESLDCLDRAERGHESEAESGPASDFDTPPGLAQALAREIRAQFERFIALTGALPTHVDGHHHIHVEPRVAQVLAPIMAREYGVCRVRLPDQAPLVRSTASHGYRDPTTTHQGFIARIEAACRVSRRFFVAQGISAPDFFLGTSFMGRELVAERLQPVLESAANASPATDSRANHETWLELMVHPGKQSRIGSDSEFSCSPEREHEASVLQSAAWQEASRGWALASFADFPTFVPRRQRKSRPRVLIYAKLTPATGNAETARRIEATWQSRVDIVWRPLIADPSDPEALAREAAALRQLVKGEYIDAVLGIHAYLAGVPLHQALADQGIPYALLISGTDANRDVDDPRRAPLLAAALKGARCVLSLNPLLVQRVERVVGDSVFPQTPLICPNGIDVRSDSPHSLRRHLGVLAGHKLVVMAAGLRPVKGVLPLLHALLPLLGERYPHHVFVLLGPRLDVAYSAEVDAAIAQAQAAWPSLSGRVWQHEGLAHDDFLAALKEADLLINASSSEGLSHVLMEAMACGVSVLASDIPGNRLLVRDDSSGEGANNTDSTGCLFPLAALETAAQFEPYYARCWPECDPSGRRAQELAETRQRAQRMMEHDFAPQCEQQALNQALERLLGL